MIWLHDAYVRHHCNVRSCHHHKRTKILFNFSVPSSLFSYELNVCVSPCACVIKSKTAENGLNEARVSVKLYSAATTYDLLLINEINSLVFRMWCQYEYGNKDEMKMMLQTDSRETELETERWNSTDPLKTLNEIMCFSINT